MQLIICEKPRVAEKLAAALSEDGFSQKKNGKVSYFEFKRGGKEIVIAPAVGHVYSLRQKKKGSGYPVFDIEWIPSSEVESGASYTKGYVSSIQKLAKKASDFVVACDYDLEGSLIGFNILRYACGTDKGFRMKFSTLTKDDLVSAYEEKSGLDYPNIHAGEARHILDWFWGINLSRALMSAIRAAGIFRVMSIGRVQGPALKLLTERERAISSFVSEPFWVVTADVKEVTFTHERDRFMKKDEAALAVKNAGKDGFVESVSKRESPMLPNPPFDLTSLQIEAYRLFKFPPSQTLAMAQTLYEASMISYPRTSSQKLPAKLGLEKIIRKLADQASYAELAKKLIGAKRFTPLEGKKEDPAHPAIHPTGVASQVGERERKLYDLIVKRFLACFAEPAVRESNGVKLMLGTERFEATGVRTLFSGWFAFYEPYLKTEEVQLPAFTTQEKVHASAVSVTEKKTKPPARFNQASVIEALEARKLGTKATRAVIVDTLFKRGYVEDKQIKVTPFGDAVCTALEHHCPDILDSELTRKFEDEMEEIQDGKIKEDAVVQDGQKELTRILNKFREHELDIGKELTVALKTTERRVVILGKCKQCGSDLRIIRSRAGKQFVGCSGYPKCTQGYPLPQFALIEPLGKTCEKCGTPLIKVIRKAKKPFEMCLDPTCETKKDWGTWKKTAPNADAKTAATEAAPAKDATALPSAPAASGTLPAPAAPLKTARATKRKPKEKKPKE